MGRLPKQLQEFRNSLKGKSFKEKMKIYFDLSSSYNSDITERRNIIKGTFSRKEQTEWEGTYKPIVMALEDYIDRIRTLDVNRQYFSYYITTMLRIKDTIEKEAEWLNGNLEAAEALKDTEAGSRLYKSLTTYENRRFRDQIYFDDELGRYVILSDTNEKATEATASLKRILSNLKGYIEALKGFMESIGKGEFIPKEILTLEKVLISTYHPFYGFKYRAIHGIPERRGLDSNASERKSLDDLEEGERDFIALNYSDLEGDGGLTGDKNLFEGSYNYYKNR